MKKSLFNIGLAALLTAGLLSSCELDETNYSTVSLDLAYKNREGFEGLVNACYIDNYFLYGKMDGIAPMEMGTDLWVNAGNNQAGYVLYNDDLNTTTGTLNVLWQSLYSTINNCNTVLYYADEVEGYTQDELNAKKAEAHFLRAWANFHLVEQFGDVVLNTQSMIEAGPLANPTRSSEEEFYELIFSDLEFATTHLPINQVDLGRAARKAAYGLLAKAALQRTRLGEESAYAQMALDAAEELIENREAYGTDLYQSDNAQSGFAKVWAGENNKDNEEALFVQVIDHAGALNPEGWNRGRTRQYFQADTRTVGQPWGTVERSRIMGRANSRYYKPTKHLLTEIFEPREDTPDTRFESSFFIRYYATEESVITEDMANQFDKDPSLIGHTILSTALKGSDDRVKAANYYAGIGWADNANYEGFVNLDEGLSMFTPNWNIDPAEKRMMPFLVNDPSDIFDAQGHYIQDASRREVYPSLSKFSNITYAYTEQYHMGNIAYMRLADIYLVAAEAAVLLNQQTKAADYVNAVRKRAALKDREDEMVVAAAEVDIDFILDERARELVGEQWRWYDLKRTGKLNSAYLSATNPAITSFNSELHLKRPIPINFLNAISNANEFGTNGY